MLNYIKSELYRSKRNGVLLSVFIGCLMILGAVVLVLHHYVNDPDFGYSNTRYTLSNIYMQLSMVYVFTIVFAMAYFGNEDRDHTLKHTVAFGIKRSTIYIGRLITTELICIVGYIILCSCFTGLSFLLLNHSNAGEIGNLIKVSLYCLPCLMFGIAITHTLILLFDNMGVSIGLAAGFIYILPLILNTLGRKIVIIHKMSYFLPYNLVSYDGPAAQMNGNEWHATVIGLGWLCITIVAGILLYQKKEIK